MNPRALSIRGDASLSPAQLDARARTQAAVPTTRTLYAVAVDGTGGIRKRITDAEWCAEHFDYLSNCRHFDTYAEARDYAIRTTHAAKEAAIKANVAAYAIPEHEPES